MSDTSNPRGWYCHETLAILPSSVNFGEAASKEDAYRLVREGTHRWVMKGGGVLTLVPIDYQLLDFEYNAVNRGHQGGWNDNRR